MSAEAGPAARPSQEMTMAKRKAGARKTARRPLSRTTGERSPKAPRPPGGITAAERPATKRRRRSATVALRKDSTLVQTDAGTKVAWGANQRRPSKLS